MTQIELTPTNIRSLQRAYNEAVANNLEQFTWHGHELVTGYAKYLLIYARQRLGLPPQA